MDCSTQASLSFTVSWSLLNLMAIAEKAMATHSSSLAWRIPWTEEPGRLQSMRSHRVRHNWCDLAAAARPLSQCCHPNISSSVATSSLLPLIIPSIRVFSNESALRIRWPKYQSFSFSISSFNKYSGLISFRTEWFDLLSVQGENRSS